VTGLPFAEDAVDGHQIEMGTATVLEEGDLVGMGLQ